MLEARFPATVETEPELVARHYTEAGCYAQAVGYWQQAGQRAMQRSAYVEAHAHLTTGLEVLATVPETPARHQHELNLLIDLAQVLRATRSLGAPELEPVLTRAAALCQQVGETPQRAAVLEALCEFHFQRVESQAAQVVAEQLLDLAQRQHDPALLLQAHTRLGQILNQVGAFTPARTHLEQGLALLDPRGHAPLPIAPHHLIQLGRALCMLGYPDQAAQRSQEALTMAHALAHPFHLINPLFMSAAIQSYRRDWQTVQAHAEAVLALATEHGFARHIALGTFFRGMALAR
jgi:tetratricopeptide (TPR) repeat protein